jgi:hypothetical protein
MDAQDRGDLASSDGLICSLEWVALAMDAARQHNEDNADNRLEYLQYFADTLLSP